MQGVNSNVLVTNKKRSYQETLGLSWRFNKLRLEPEDVIMEKNLPVDIEYNPKKKNLTNHNVLATKVILLCKDTTLSPAPATRSVSPYPIKHLDFNHIR